MLLDSIDSCLLSQEPESVHFHLSTLRVTRSIYLQIVQDTGYGRRAAESVAILFPNEFVQHLKST